MSLSTLALDAGWRDHVGMWNPLVEPRFAPLDGSPCHAPRLALAPDVSHWAIPEGGKNSYNFNLVAGSIIWGIWAFGGGREFTLSMQLTDVALDHKFFQEPVDPTFLDNLAQSDTDRFPSWFLLPTPHPVVGEGLFTLEIWGPPGISSYILLGVAEVKDCNV